MAWSWRTIFLLIRGVDQTGRAFAGPTRALTKLQQRQKALARSSYRLLFAGAAFLAFGMMAAKALSGLFTMTGKGKLMTDDLSLAWRRFATTVSEQTTKILGPSIMWLTRLLDKLAANPAFAAAIGMTGVGIVALSLLAAVVAWGGAAAKGLAVLFKLGGAVAGAAGAGGVQTTMTQFLGGAAAGAGIKAGIVAKLGSMFTAIKGAAVTYGAAGLQVAIPVLLTLAIAKVVWFMSQSKEKQLEMAIAAGEQIAGYRERMGLPAYETRPEMLSPGIYTPLDTQGNVYVDIHGNIWERDVDEEELGRELGYHIVEEGSNKGLIPVMP